MVPEDVVGLRRERNTVSHRVSSIRFTWRRYAFTSRVVRLHPAAASTCVFRSSRSRVSRQAGQPFRSKAFTGFGPWRSATSEETRDQ
jgi:hypothetical protein